MLKLPLVIGLAFSSFAARPAISDAPEWFTHESATACTATQNYDAVQEATLALVALRTDAPLLVVKSVHFGQQGRKIMDLDLGAGGAHRVIAYASRGSDGRPLFTIDLTPELMEAFGKADMVAFQIGDRTIATLLPEGNQAAIQFIAECAQRVALKNKPQ
jgi:hypothetical protein